MLDFLRRRMLPLMVWLAAMGTAGWLWYGLHLGSARGYVEGISYGIAAPQTGRIASIAVWPGQRVQPGQVIATLDDSAVVEELELLAMERRQVEAEIRAAAAEAHLVMGRSSREIEESVESAELAGKQARAERSVRAAELLELDAQVQAVRELVDKRMADRRDLVELTVRHAALRKQLQEDDGIIRQLDTQVSSARGRRVGLPADGAEHAIEPLQAALEVIRARESLLARHREALSLRSPGAGEITAVHLRPGELAVEGAMVATITGPAELSADGRPVVYVCVTEDAAVAIKEGEAVRLGPPEGGGSWLSAHVQRLAPAVGQLPIRCWHDPRIPEWGRGVYVVTDEPVSLLPGQTFSIAFTGEPSAAHGSSEPEPEPISMTTPPAPLPPTFDLVAPAELHVPPELRARTRFEPSAVAWWPGRERYLLASDDTGLPGATEHLPWLFTMDAAGHVDPEPLVVAGLEALNDVESIALAPEGGLYVLASQSRSRKGKRSGARQQFAYVELSATGARATASVRLASLLDAAGADGLAALGITDTEDLDIEGLTSTAGGGLLLGLKGPLGADAAAIVWHLPDPQRLLATGELGQGGLVTWGRIPLTIVADGATRPGGISDLLELPDGSLLIAATAAGASEPRVQDGALYHVRDRAMMAEPVLVRTFAGRKPEGLSRSADGQSIVIVFDRGDAPAEWMEQPWPAP